MIPGSLYQSGSFLLACWMNPRVEGIPLDESYEYTLSDQLSDLEFLRRLRHELTHEGQHNIDQTPDLELIRKLKKIGAHIDKKLYRCSNITKNQ